MLPIDPKWLSLAMLPRWLAFIAVGALWVWVFDYLT